MLRMRSFVALPLLAACVTITACSSDPAAPVPLDEQLESDTGTKWAVYVEPSSNGTPHGETHG